MNFLCLISFLASCKIWKFGGKLIERIFFDAILCFSLSYFIWQASYSFIPGSYCIAFSTLFRHNDINNLYVTPLLQHIGYMGFNWYLCRNSGSLIFFLLLSFYDLSIILRQKYHFFYFSRFLYSFATAEVLLDFFGRCSVVNSVSFFKIPENLYLMLLVVS